MGRSYAARRNYDLGPGCHKHVSMFSPYVRHRVLAEQALVQAAIGTHGYPAAEKFVQEVFWRTYWKGWLERRPEIWARYEADVTALIHRLNHDNKQFDAYHMAVEGRTGIDCFDAWVHELRSTGYLHNHARMWFASIWIFTLGLPWPLGADFFLQHLLDGDTASNTLSWRWVAGLQTKGKNYLARAGNIQRYTDSRFNPVGQLANAAEPLDDVIPLARPSPATDPIPSGPLTLILTDDHLDPLSVLGNQRDVRRVLILRTVTHRTPRGVHPVVRDFVLGLEQDCQRRLESVDIETMVILADEVHKVSDCVPPDSAVIALYAPLGAGRKALEQAETVLERSIPKILPKWDQLCYQHCTKGFFNFKKEIANLITALID